MKFSESLYENVKEIWEYYYNRPFVKGMNDGTLDVNKFKYYMIQDYIYMNICFGKCLITRGCNFLC